MLRTVEGGARAEPAAAGRHVAGPPRRAGPLVPAVVVAAGVAACLYRLGAASLWLDEAVTATFARVDAAAFWDAVRNDGGNQALYYLLARAWSAVSTGETWLRLLSVVFAVGALVTLYHLGHRLFGRRVALLAVLLLAVNPFFVRYAQEARGYSLSLLLVTAAALALVQAVDSGSGRAWALYGLLAALAVWAHLFGLFFVAALSASVLVLRRKLPWRSLAGAAALGLALLVPVVPLALARSSGEDAWRADEGSSVALVRRVAAALLGERGELANASVAAFCLAGVVVALSPLRGRDRRGWAGVMVVAWAAAAGVVVALSLAVPMLAPRYLIAALPAIALLAALGLDRIPSTPMLVAALALLVGLSGVRISRQAGDVRFQDWRSATASVLASAQPGDRLVFYAPYIRLPFEYYATRAGVPREALPTLVPGEARFAPLPVGRARSPYVPADLEVLSSPSPGGLWIVSYLLPQDESSVSYTEVTEAVERGHQLAEERSFTGIRVRRYLPGTPPR